MTLMDKSLHHFTVFIFTIQHLLYKNVYKHKLQTHTQTHTMPYAMQKYTLCIMYKQGSWHRTELKVFLGVVHLEGETQRAGFEGHWPQRKLARLPLKCWYVWIRHIWKHKGFIQHHTLSSSPCLVTFSSACSTSSAHTCTQQQ